MKALNRNVMVESRVFPEGTLWLGIPEEVRKQIPEAYFTEPDKVEDGSGPGDPVGSAERMDLAASAPVAAPAKAKRTKRAKSRRR